MRNITRDLLITLIVAFGFFLLFHFILGSFTITGPSMEPGLQPDTRVLVFKMAYSFSEPRRGDIVYYRSLEGKNDQLKRVVALPGETVEIHDGDVYVNGSRLDEPYVRQQPAYSLDTFQVPFGSYFVLGDNRNSSSDSSSGWTLPGDNLLGRAWIITWPPTDWGGAGNYRLSSQPVAASFPQ
jgi:signal peptidase I